MEPAPAGGTVGGSKWPFCIKKLADKWEFVESPRAQRAEFGAPLRGESVIARCVSAAYPDVERYPYPREAVREIIFNALVHNNWSGCTPIQIRVDDDCLRISNCCILPMGWTQENLTTHHQSKPYNPLIAETFFRAGYIESWGRGIDNVNKYCQEKNYPLPKFELIGEDLTVIFRPDAKITKQKSNKLKSKYTETETKVLELLKNTPSITQKEIVEELNISRRTVQRTIKMFVDKGIIKRNGTNVQGSWDIICSI